MLGSPLHFYIYILPDHLKLLGWVFVNLNLSFHPYDVGAVHWSDIYPVLYI